jgi:AraC-like DNA-binding protein
MWVLMGYLERRGRGHSRKPEPDRPRGRRPRPSGAAFARGRPPSHPVNRYPAEFFLATWLRLGRDTCAPDIAPLDARFFHAAPPRQDEHRRFFACPVLFEQPVVGLLMVRSDLERPMRGADPALASLLGRQLDKLLVGLRAPGLELAEIAFLLGYSEWSAFHRSFKRWTGRTPLEFRREALPRPSAYTAG